MWLVGIVICAGWIFSLCLHEFSHAIVAYWGGDTSVKDKGYLTFNPLKYTDPGYSIALPLLFLLMGGIGLPGGAVYINQHKLRNRWWQTAVSAAGPTANIFMALVLAIFFRLSAGDNLALNNQINEDSFLLSGIAFLIYLQVFAAIFNLLPIPGLDGYGIIEPWLPNHVRNRFNDLRKYSTLIIVGLFWYAPWFSNSAFKVVGLISNNFLQIPDTFIGMGSSLFRQPINQLITLVILLTFGWSLNSQKKRPIQTGKKNSVKKKVTPTDRVYPETRKTSTQKGGNSVKEKVNLLNQVHPETRKRAIVLAGHDMERIERLLNGARLKHPDRLEQWYWEKILYDMERDRRL
jgi:Zn-dependent protease